MSTAQFTCPLIVTIPGQLIASSLWNNEFTNIFNNLNTAGIGGHSDTDPDMQTATDPYPGAATSRPAALSGEIERLRFVLKDMKGTTYWYVPGAATLAALNTRVTTLEGALTAAAGTKMVFYQAAAPTGWTQVVTQNDKALRVVSAAGGGSGGTNAMSAGLSHSHTVNSHTHDLGNHTHSLANHTHASSAHTHTVPAAGWSSAAGPGSTGTLQDGGGNAHPSSDNTSGSTTPADTGTPSTNTSGTPSTNTSGATAPGTDTQAPTLQYIDVIVCSKN